MDNKGKVNCELFVQSLQASFSYRSKYPSIFVDSAQEDTPKVDHSKFNRWSVQDAKSSKKCRMSSFKREAVKKKVAYKYRQTKSTSVAKKTKTRSTSRSFRGKKNKRTNIVKMEDIAEMNSSAKNTIFVEIF